MEVQLIDLINCVLIMTYTLKGSFASDVNVILNVTLKIKEILI